MKISKFEIKEPIVRKGTPEPQKVNIRELTEDAPWETFRLYNLNKIGDIVEIPEDYDNIEFRQIYVREPNDDELKRAEEAKQKLKYCSDEEKPKLSKLSDPYNGIPKATLISVLKNSQVWWMTVASLRHYGYLKNENGEFIPCPLDDVAEKLKKCKNDFERIVACAGKTIMAEGYITAYVDKWVDGVKTDEKYERNIICLKFIE